MADTVENAASTPDQPQPWAELGVKEDEYLRIREILGRRPTGAELAMYSVMWSEHCSYKSSKVHLRKFAELPAETPAGKLLAGIGENAGVIDIGQGYAVTFKVRVAQPSLATWSPTRAPPPAWVASSATSWPWVRGRSR